MNEYLLEQNISFVILTADLKLENLVLIGTLTLPLFSVPLAIGIWDGSKRQINKTTKVALS